MVLPLVPYRSTYLVREFTYLGEQVADPTVRQDVVDVNQEPLVDDLSVRHEEKQRNALHPRGLEHLLQSLLKVFHLSRRKTCHTKGK